jgi:hypothetical protein
LSNNRKDIDDYKNKIQELKVVHKNYIMRKITINEYYENLASFLYDLTNDIKNNKVFGEKNIESLILQQTNLTTLYSQLKDTIDLGNKEKKQEIEKNILISYTDIQRTLVSCLEFYNSVHPALNDIVDSQKFNVFISSPSVLNEQQSTFRKMLKIILKNKKLIVRDLTPEEYPNERPIVRVKKTIQVCNGVIILGMQQMIVKDCIVKKGTLNENRRHDILLPTPWNHIEAAISITMGLPILIISERGIEGGVFDPEITEEIVHQVELNIDSFDSEEFINAINLWLEQIIDKSKK